jgi:flagellar protein FliS
MNHRTGWHAYREVAVQTASPAQLIVMLYDGAIRFLQRASQGFNQEDPAEFNQTINNNVLRAQAIIHELDRSLDMEKGGEFAATMRRLYDYFHRLLHESNLMKKPEGIEEIIRRLTVLRDAWAQISRSEGGSDPSSTAPVSATG